jgi:hypothetical protein
MDMGSTEKEEPNEATSTFNEVQSVVMSEARHDSLCVRNASTWLNRQSHGCMRYNDYIVCVENASTWLNRQSHGCMRYNDYIVCVGNASTWLNRQSHVGMRYNDYSHESVCGSESVAPHILNFGTRLR